MNINILLQLPDQLRVWHWMTTSYAQHMAFGSAYDAISDLVDSLVETYSGKHGRPTITDMVKIHVENSTDHKVVIEAYITEIESWDFKDEIDLENIQADIIIELQKLKYLLTLK